MIFPRTCEHKATSWRDVCLLQLDGHCAARWIGPGDCYGLPSYDIQSICRNVDDVVGAVLRKGDSGVKSQGKGHPKAHLCGCRD